MKYTDLKPMIRDGIIKPQHVDLLHSTNCLKTMQPEFIEYVVGKSLVYAFPVLDIFTNPRNSMQGGFVAAAFDNVFGILVYLSTKQVEMASVDLSINFIRPIFGGDTLQIKTYLRSQGKTIVHLTGEAFDKKNKLISTASVNIMLLGKNKYFKKV